jgi:hypothetical protein
MIGVLLTTLLEVIKIDHDVTTGNADERDASEARKRFYQALCDMVDHRIQLAFDERRRHQSYERIAVADSINVNIKTTASTIRSISALNSAPPPPEDIYNTKAMQEWQDAYKAWYQTKRKAGIDIE